MSESKSEKEHRKESSEVSYGEPVGVVAAQSLGEPATQMVLKSFHTAGVSSVVTTTGLPRVIEIIDARKRVKLPVMRIRAEKSIAKDYEKVKQLKQKIEEIKLRSLLTNYDEDIKSGTIKFNFNRESLSENGLTVSQVASKISKHFEGIEISTESGSITVKYKSKRDAKNMRTAFVHILNFAVAGIAGISKAVVQQSEDGTFYIVTSGSNMAKVIEIEGVDKDRIYSNDIFEVLRVYGIEAARNLIASEIQKTLLDEGFGIGFRHISLVADTMTYTGAIRSIGRHGIAGDKASVLARAAYEETVKHFVNASVFGERDPLKGVAENILIGKQIAVGTGRIKLAVRKEDLKKIKSSYSEK